MGLLDDAIREHLDLKRRRGADPTEVERAEREALGPVRRIPQPESVEDATGEPEPAYDVESEQDWQEESIGEEPDVPAAPAPSRRRFSPSEMFRRSAPPPDDEPPPPDESSPYEERGPADESPLPERPARSEYPASSDHPAPPRFSAPPNEGQDYLAEDPLGDPFAEDDHPGTPPPHAAPASTPSRRAEPAGGETVEYRLDEAAEAEHKQDGEDVLEETPEFLQDTPDHDRLWFEQRPPKDFDFDG